MRAEGVQAALHPHVGGWVETEAEVRAVLDERRPRAAGLRPGHRSHVLGRNGCRRGAGRLLDRIVGVHLKDTFAAGIARAKAEDLNYHDATRPGRIWAEPGTGQVDLSACVRIPDSGFTGDYMIEVDIPSVPLRECHQIAYDWALAHLPLRREAPTGRRGVTVRSAPDRGGRLRRHRSRSTSTRSGPIATRNWWPSAT